MLKVIGLLADDDELREVLTECRKDRTLEPLRTLVDRDGDESAAAEVLSVLMAEASPTEVLPQ